MGLTAIYVSENAIAIAKRANAMACPIALVIKAVVRPDVFVSTNGSVAVLSTPNRGLALKLPSSVTKFVNRYDVGYDVHPFWFQMFIPESWLRSKPAQIAVLEGALMAFDVDVMSDQCNHDWMLPTTLLEHDGTARVTGRCKKCGLTELRTVSVWGDLCERVIASQDGD